MAKLMAFRFRAVYVKPKFAQALNLVVSVHDITASGSSSNENASFGRRVGGGQSIRNLFRRELAPVGSLLHSPSSLCDQTVIALLSQHDLYQLFSGFF